MSEISFCKYGIEVLYNTNPTVPRNIIFDNTKLVNYIRENSLTTPCYIYDLQLLDDTFAIAKKALGKNFKNAEIHYAIKVNHHPKIVNITKKYAMGIDCVSGGEVKRALEQKVAPEHIVFAVVDKADWEIELAIDNDIFAKHYLLPKLKRGDLLAIYSAGAYGKVLASEYNLKPTVQEYFI